MDSLTPLYVSDPVLNKDGITSFTSYTLRGTRVPDPIIRRYRDFDCLRNKLMERWPGIFIPNIPHKKIMGANEKEVVDMRIGLMNRFLSKIANIGYLFNSEELEIFLQSSGDISKNFSALSSQSWEDILKKYSKSFLEFDDNYDITEGKAFQSKFLMTLKELLPKIRDFKYLVEKNKKNFHSNQESNNQLLNLMTLYEKEVLKVYANDNEEKLLLFNTQNVDLCHSITDFQEKTVNPYDKLLDDITADYLDTEAMIEAIESINSLQNQYESLLKKFNSVTNELNEMQAGKSNLKSIFSFKSKEEYASNLDESKKKLDTDIQNLGQVIKICSFNIDSEINNFKYCNLETYYKELSYFEKISSSNLVLMNKMCENILINENMVNI